MTAGEGTLAESFFDPARDGAALSATTTIGTVKWEAGTVEAMLTLDVTGHKLDFIALNGTVILSLDAADATDTGSVLSWPVAAQPWEAGDKLMLRIDTPPIVTPPPPPAPSGLTARVGSRSVTLNWHSHLHTECGREVFGAGLPHPRAQVRGEGGNRDEKANASDIVGSICPHAAVGRLWVSQQDGGGDLSGQAGKSPLSRL